jgi:2-hydroxycyclohexanecarboxyl-CoA dehydrogenase
MGRLDGKTAVVPAWPLISAIMLNDYSAYMGTQAGFDHVIRCIANEFGNRGIRANSISPGLTDTPMNAEAKKIPGLLDVFVNSYPLGRIAAATAKASASAY